MGTVGYCCCELHKCIYRHTRSAGHAESMVCRGCFLGLKHTRLWGAVVCSSIPVFGELWCAQAYPSLGSSGVSAWLCSEAPHCSRTMITKAIALPLDRSCATVQPHLSADPPSKCLPVHLWREPVSQTCRFCSIVDALPLTGSHVFSRVHTSSFVLLFPA